MHIAFIIKHYFQLNNKLIDYWIEINYDLKYMLGK
jgi:hypothetical protein